MVQVRARCGACERVEVVDAPLVAPANDNWTPICHGAPMEVLGPLFPPRTDPHDVQVSLLDVKEPPPEECAEWKNPRQVWFLRPGRQGGEKIGWLGESPNALGYHYLLVAGVRETYRRGFAATKARAVSDMLLELDR